MPQFATLPEPPYYAVIFSSQRHAEDEGYGAMAQEMVALAATQAGFLGVESTRDAAGFGVTVSYSTDESAVRAWKTQARHLIAQSLGKARWYEHYALRVARVERAYEGPEGR